MLCMNVNEETVYMETLAQEEVEVTIPRCDYVPNTLLSVSQEDSDLSLVWQ